MSIVAPRELPFSKHLVDININLINSLWHIPFFAVYHLWVNTFIISLEGTIDIIYSTALDLAHRLPNS